MNEAKLWTEGSIKESPVSVNLWCLGRILVWWRAGVSHLAPFWCWAPCPVVLGVALSRPGGSALPCRAGCAELLILPLCPGWIWSLLQVEICACASSRAWLHGHELCFGPFGTCLVVNTISPLQNSPIFPFCVFMLANMKFGFPCSSVSQGTTFRWFGFYVYA